MTGPVAWRVAAALLIVLTPAAVESAVHGPEAPGGFRTGPRLSSPSVAPRHDWTRDYPRLGESDEDDTIERVSGERRGPRIAEPMIFDLIRPLGARRGEAEANVLGLVPLGRRMTGPPDGATDPLGLVPDSPEAYGLEWAPEIEYAIRDNVAVEFELPLENARLEAYKAGWQVTFGTALRNRYIHGLQGIVQYNAGPKTWTPTLLYLAGFRLDPVWSLFGMFGTRGDIGRHSRASQIEMLSNVTVFADASDRFVLGLETNFTQALDGRATLLLMPQLHYELGRYWMIQGGTGVRLAAHVARPEVGFRLIREF